MSNSKRENEQHLDHSDELSRLRKIMGQLAGIERMITTKRNRPEVVQQIWAGTSFKQPLNFSKIACQKNGKLFAQQSQKQSFPSDKMKGSVDDELEFIAEAQTVTGFRGSILKYYPMIDIKEMHESKRRKNNGKK